VNVILVTFQTSIVPTVLRLGLFAFGPFQTSLTIFDGQNFPNGQNLTVQGYTNGQKRSETEKMKTEPNSERPETPRTEKWET